MGIVSNGSFWIYDTENLNDTGDWPTDYRVPADYIFRPTTITTDYTWTVPTGATSISIVAIGAGGYASSTNGSDGGGGGAIAWINNRSITSGDTVSVHVPVSSPVGSVSNTYVSINSIKVIEAGSGSASVAGSVVIGTGYPGGAGGTGTPNFTTGGGGSAGGFGGAGARGGRYPSYPPSASLTNIQYTVAGQSGSSTDVWGWDGNTSIQYGFIPSISPTAGYTRFASDLQFQAMFNVGVGGIAYTGVQQGNPGIVRIVVNGNRQFPYKTSCDWYKFSYTKRET